MGIHLSTPIEKLTRVGKITATKLARLGIKNVQQLLEHYPARFEDYSAQLKINQLSDGDLGTIFGTLASLETKQTARSRMKLTQGELDDGTGTIKLIWFNQPYISQSIHEGDSIAVAGKIERDFTGWVLKNPNFEKASSLKNAVHTARLVPLYPLTQGLTQKQVRFLMTQALEAKHEYAEILPSSIINEYGLVSKQTALQHVHLPQDAQSYVQAKKSLQFEELFLIQLLVETARTQLSSTKAPKIKFYEHETKKLVDLLPFKLTGDQKKAAWQILRDIQKPIPMNRLLQGEVGSGKTVVTALAIANAKFNQFQSALMAPTEILALQHFQTLTKLFPNVRIAVLTGKYAQLHPVNTRGIAASRGSLSRVLSGLPRKDIKKTIAAGAVDLVIGTQALIQHDVIFSNLALVIVDEQHRFGVEQRKSLKQKQSNKLVPHLLSMTATPIPRSLSLTLYGDLDISTIVELPKGRKKIYTKLVDNNNRDKAYQFIKQKIQEGRQVFVICPLIEESDTLGIASTTQEYEKLNKKIFPDIKISLLHGKLKTQEKENVMREFKNNKASILVATAVVEVGIDVPNASIIAIESSDRFGLSQLHQFRGRVGRGEHQSYCFLFTDSESPQTAKRLQAFVQARDGFEIAELDLELRGPGQMYGTQQSGAYTDLRIASLADTELMSHAKKEAKKLLQNDPALTSHALLASELATVSHGLHFE